MSLLRVGVCNDDVSVSDEVGPGPFGGAVGRVEVPERAALDDDGGGACDIVCILAVEEIPVVMKERQAGKSSISPKRSVYYMIKVSLACVMAALSA